MLQIYNIYTYTHIYIHIYIYIYIYIRGFSHWGKWGESLPHLPKICSCPPHLEKFPHRIHAPPPSTTSSIFSCSHWSCSIFVLISYSLDTQVMLIFILIDVQYSQKAVFSLEKGSNCQNHSSSGSFHLVKSSLSKIFDSVSQYFY